jgi:signal transduction histidine kinase
LETSANSLQQRLVRLQRVVEVSLTLNSTLELEPLLDVIIETAQEITHTEGASILLLDKETGELRFRAATGQKRHALKPVAVPLDNSIAGYIVRTGMALLIPNVKDDPRFGGQVDEAVDFTTRSILGVPLMVKERTIGVLEVVNKIGHSTFDEEDAYILTTMAAQAAIALENSRLITELQDAYEELNQLDQLKSEFIAIASHELRTPLSVILGYVTFLQRDATGELRDQLDVVVRSALRLRSLIDDMINLRHVETGEAELDLEHCDVVELVLSTCDEFRELSQAKGQVFSIATPDAPIPARLDRDKIRLALGNLISNAIKFSPEEGQITVEVAPANDSAVTITVTDTGIGISERDQKRIFDRFYQAEHGYTRRFEGMGLGLSIAKSLVDIHGGVLEVKSELGQGSAFTIRLPAIA